MCMFKRRLKFQAHPLNSLNINHLKIFAQFYKVSRYGGENMTYYSPICWNKMESE